MAEKLSPWCKKAKIAMIQKDIGVSDMAERLGNCLVLRKMEKLQQMSRKNLME